MRAPGCAWRGRSTYDTYQTRALSFPSACTRAQALRRRVFDFRRPRRATNRARKWRCMLSLGVPAAAATRVAAAAAHRRSQTRRPPARCQPARGTARDTAASDASLVRCARDPGAGVRPLCGHLGRNGPPADAWPDPRALVLRCSLAPSDDFLRLTRERGASEASLQTSVVTLECRTPDGCVVRGALGGVHTARARPLTVATLQCHGAPDCRSGQRCARGRRSILQRVAGAAQHIRPGPI